MSNRALLYFLDEDSLRVIKNVLVNQEFFALPLDFQFVIPIFNEKRRGIFVKFLPLFLHV